MCHFEKNYGASMILKQDHFEVKEKQDQKLTELNLY